MAAFVVAAAGPRVASAFPLVAADTPNDGGHSINLTWTPPATPPAQWSVMRREAPNGAFEPVATIDGTDHAYQDAGRAVADRKSVV